MPNKRIKALQYNGVRCIKQPRGWIAITITTPLPSSSSRPYRRYYAPSNRCGHRPPGSSPSKQEKSPIFLQVPTTITTTTLFSIVDQTAWTLQHPFFTLSRHYRNSVFGGSGTCFEWISSCFRVQWKVHFLSVCVPISFVRSFDLWSLILCNNGRWRNLRAISSWSEWIYKKLCSELVTIYSYWLIWLKVWPTALVVKY